MIKDLFLIVLIFFSSSQLFSKTITLKNSTGETIVFLSVVKQDSTFESPYAFRNSNLLSKPLGKGDEINIEASEDIVKVYAISGSLEFHEKVFLVPMYNTKKKSLKITAEFLISDYSNEDFLVVELNDVEYPRVMIEVKNELDLDIYCIYYKGHNKDDKYDRKSILPIWQSFIQTGENRKIFFFPELDIIRDANGNTLNYKGDFDFIIYGVTPNGKFRKYEVLNFDVVNDTNITFK